LNKEEFWWREFDGIEEKLVEYLIEKAEKSQGEHREKFVENLVKNRLGVCTGFSAEHSRWLKRSQINTSDKLIEIVENSWKFLSEKY
jgi:hypothetical protein